MFGIFDLTFPKIADPTIFVRESFIFAGNFLARRAGARRVQFLRTSPPIVSRVARPCRPASPRRRLVQVVKIRSRRCDRSPSLTSLQQNDAAMDLLAGVASHEGRRGGGDGSPSLASLQQKETAMDLLRPRAKKGGGTRGKENSRVRGLVSRETTTTWRVQARQAVQDSRDIKITKPLCLCKNAKFGPSNAKFAKMHKSNAKLLESNF